jgi:hypothetical protein
MISVLLLVELAEAKVQERTVEHEEVTEEEHRRSGGASQVDLAVHHRWVQRCIRAIGQTRRPPRTPEALAIRSAYLLYPLELDSIRSHLSMQAKRRWIKEMCGGTY